MRYVCYILFVADCGVFMYCCLHFVIYLLFVVVCVLIFVDHCSMFVVYWFRVVHTCCVMFIV